MFEQNLYRFFNAVLFFMCCLLGLGKELGIAEVLWSHVMAGLAVLSVASIWCRVKLKGRLILVLTAVLSLVVTVFVVGSGRTYGHLRNYITGFWRSNEEAVIWGLPQECIQAAVIAVICFGIALLFEQFFVLKFIAGIILLGLMVVGLFWGSGITHAGVVCVLLYVVIVYVEWTQRGWCKERLGNNRHYMFSMLPFLVVYLVLMLLMPAPEKPYDWQFVKDAYAGMRQAFMHVSRNLMNGDREDLTFGNGTVGFGGSGKLIGSISDDERTVLILNGQENLKTNVYLVGRVYDTFEGDKWTSTDSNEMDERQLDALETLYAVRKYNKELANGDDERYVAETILRIRYEDFRSSYLLAPLKTYKLDDLGETQYTSEGGNYVFGKKQGFGQDYRVSYFQLNVDHPAFYEFLRQNLTEDDDLFQQVQRECMRTRKYRLTDLVNHKKHIFEIYEKECELSETVRLWVAEALQGAETDIDKLKAIEAALQQMVYTKTPGALPQSVDSETEFLDYFLLESKQGYCVYYATAFVLLARAEGIPARYVEGFCVPMTSTQNVCVSSSMAHAWPEVYIENMGWVPFEPTPGYAAIRYTPWEVQAEESGTGKGASAEGLDDYETDSVDEWEDEEEQAENVTVAEEEISVKTENTGNLFIILGLSALFALIAGAVIWGLDTLIRINRRRRYTLQEKFVAQIRINMRLLAFLGYDRMANETLQELRQRAWAIMDNEEETGPEFLFLKFYEEYLYGEYPVTEEMLDVLVTEKSYLMQLLKKWKPILYLYCRFRSY